jgi:hypothetical protein
VVWFFAQASRSLAAAIEAGTILYGAERLLSRKNHALEIARRLKAKDRFISEVSSF